MRKLAFCICENKDAVTAKLISAFVFATRIVQSLYFLNPKFQASSHLLWLYSLVCVGPVRNPRKPLFSERGSYQLLYVMSEEQIREFLVMYHPGIEKFSDENRSETMSSPPPPPPEKKITKTNDFHQF